MRSRPVAQLRLLLGGLAASGVVAAHVLASFLAEPGQHTHTNMVGEMDHQRWTIVMAAALGITVAGLIRYACGRAWSPGTNTPPSDSLFAHAALRLVPIQVLGCVSLGGVERWFSDQGVLGVLAEPTVLIGVCLQLVVALIGAGILVLFAKAIDLILKRGPRPKFSVGLPTPRPISHVHPPRFQVATGFGTVRGPPSPLLVY